MENLKDQLRVLQQVYNMDVKVTKGNRAGYCQYRFKIYRFKSPVQRSNVGYQFKSYRFFGTEEMAFKEGIEFAKKYLEQRYIIENGTPAD